MTVSVSGTTEVAQYLYAYRRSGDAACAPTALIEESSASDLTYGTYLAAGPFSKVYSFTPAVSGRYRVCVYVGAGASVAPLATQTATVDVRLPTASINPITLSADPTEDKPVTVSVSGTTEVAQYLYAYRRSGDAACAPTALIEESSASDLTYGTYLAAGPFSKVYSFTPAVSGRYRVCVYVGAGASVAPLATQTATVDVRSLRASLAVDGLTPYVTGQAVSLIAHGDVEEAGTLQWELQEGDATCPASPRWDAGTVGLARGPFAVGIPVTYTSKLAHTLCAWVHARGRSGALLAARYVISKVGLTAPTALNATADRSRRASFSWASGPTGVDELVLREGRKAILYVNEAGATTTAGAKRRAPGLAKVVRGDDGMSRVALIRPLPPGQYTWSVVRTRDAGEQIASADTGLRVAGPRLTQLRVRTKAQRGTSSRRPGSTVLTIRTTPFTRVTLTLRRAGTSRVIPLAWGAAAVGRQRVTWSCGAKGSNLYRYTVTARDEQGRTMRRSGRFRSVSISKCRSLKAQEARARQRRAAAEARRLAAAARRDAAAAQARRNRFIRNCGALGGTAVTLQTGAGTTIVCRGPYGGYIWVPS